MNNMLEQLKFLKEWSWLISSVIAVVSAIFSFITWFTSKKIKNKVRSTAVSSITIEIIINYMSLVQESKLFLLNNYTFRRFVRDDSWRELKATMREVLDAKLFKTIDNSYFLLYQIESGFQRLHDFNECNNASDHLVVTAKRTLERSINQLRKSADKNMDNAIDEFYEWKKANS